MTPEQIDADPKAKARLPWWADLAIYVLERIGLPVILLGFGGYYGVQHLERVGRHLERSDEVQALLGTQIAALAKEIAASRDESKVTRIVMERIADKLDKEQ